MSRKWFVIVAVLALIASSCGGGREEAAPAEVAGPAQPTTAPESTAVPGPTETPATAVPDPAVVPEPTAAPQPDPTSVPADEAAPLEAGSGCGAGSTPGTTTVEFEFEGVPRVYEQVVPSSYDDSSPMPVVLNWHGLGSNGPEQIGFSEYGTLAETEGFIVIAPTGLPADNGANSWELTPEQEPDRDDLAFANTLLDVVLATVCADEARVYTTGMSNGGYFSAVLVCEMSERIAAAASVAALTHADDCEPARSVPYIGFHGTEDLTVPYDGGGVSNLAPDVNVPLFELKILDEFAEFAVGAGCDPEPVVAAFSDTITSFDFQNCTDGVPMTFYEIEGGGHTWPGSALSLVISEAFGMGITTTEINASQTSWDFFEQHSLTE